MVLESLAAVNSPLKGRRFTLDPETLTWEFPLEPAPSFQQHKAEADALAALADAWERRAGVMPLAAQVYQAAERAGLTVAEIGAEPADPIPEGAVN